MDQQEIIAGYEARAKAIGLPIATVCERAEVHPTTFSRWKLSERNPDPVSAGMKRLKRIDDALAELESEVSQAAA